MRMLLLHPEVAGRSCDDCRAWQYLDRPGNFAADPHPRGGRPMRRPPGTPTPCAYCPKQPPDVPDRDRTPATAIDLTARNWQAYRHYRECKAVGVFPDDETVRRDAALIAAAEKSAERNERLQLAILGRGLTRREGD